MTNIRYVSVVCFQCWMILFLWIGPRPTTTQGILALQSFSLLLQLHEKAGYIHFLLQCKWKRREPYKPIQNEEIFYHRLVNLPLESLLLPPSPLIIDSNVQVLPGFRPYPDTAASFSTSWIKLCCVNIDQSNVIGMVLPLPPPATDWTQSAWFDLAAKQLGPVLAFCQLLNSANDPVLSATIAGIIIICRVEADKI